MQVTPNGPKTTQEMARRDQLRRWAELKRMRFENVHVVEARSPFRPIWRAGRGLITTLSWNISVDAITTDITSTTGIELMGPTPDF